MQRRDWMWINGAAATLLALGGITMVAHAGGGAQAQLPINGDVAAPHAQGQVLFLDNGGGQRQLQVEIKDATEAAGQTVHIRFIDRAKESESEKENESKQETENEKANDFGTMTLDAKGQGKIRLETKNGDNVPLSVSGKNMKLRLDDGRAAAGASFK